MKKKKRFKAETPPKEEGELKTVKAENDGSGFTLKKVISIEGFVTLAIVLAIFVPIACIMGFGNMLNTIFSNAMNLLTETCFYLLSVSVIVGALGSVLTEFGVIALANKALSPLMKPIYGMPGATSMAIFEVFLSDNPAVLTLTDDPKYRRYFKKYQLAGLASLGTAFGMGLIVIIKLANTALVGDGSVGLAIVAGILGAVIGSIFSTRIMLRRAKKIYGDEEATPHTDHDYDVLKEREVRSGGFLQRFFDSLLEGGASGVKIGLAIIPGVLIIANVVMLLSDGYGTETVLENGVYITRALDHYKGVAGQGIGLLPWIGEKLSVVFNWLFGFDNPSAISVPITALGSAGAAVELVGDNMYTATEIAVFTSMCMFWSGFLSTRVSMMDSMGIRKLTVSSILFHILGGLIAGFCAHWIYALFALML